MFSRLFNIISIIIFLVNIISGQSLETVMEKHYKAVGMDKIKDIKTVKTVSTLNQMGMSFTVTELKKRPSMHKSIADINGMKIVSVYNGKEAWMVNPMTGSQDAEPVTGDELERIKYQASIEGLFYAYKNDKSVKTEYKGEVTENGVTYDKVIFTLPQGDNIEVFINSENHYIEMVKMTQSMQGQEAKSVINLSDHRVVNGMIFPHSAIVSVNGEPMFTSKVESITFDVDIPDTEFQK